MDGSVLDFDIIELVAVPAPPPAERVCEVAFRGQSYLPEELGQLRQLFLADTSFEEMATAIGRTLAGLRTKVSELGWRRRSFRTWSDLDDDHLLLHYGSVPAATLAAELGRTPAQIYGRAVKLDLTEPNPTPYSLWEDAQIRRGYHSEVAMPVAQIAALIARPASGIIDRAGILDLKHPNRRPEWTDDELVRVLALAETGLPYRKIGEQLTEEGPHPRNANGVEKILHSLGYRRGSGRPWTAEEEDAVRATYQRGESLRALGFRLGRGPSSVSWKAGELGLHGTHPRKNGFRNGPDWTEEDRTYLKTHYGRMKAKLIATHLGRETGAIYNKASALNLNSGYQRPFTDDEERGIRIGHANGLSLRDLADALDRSRAVISKHSISKNIRFNTRSVAAPKGPRANRRKWTLEEILALDAGEPSP